jgi:peptidyl-prolyl cis-trans isomerase SurA
MEKKSLFTVVQSPAMKRAMVLALIIGLVLVSGCKSGAKATADLAATVNGKDITVTELERQFKARVQGANPPPAADEVQDAKMQLLEQMINDEILLQLAAKENLTASDAEVELRFNEFKTQGQYTEESFQDQLKKQQMTVADIKQQLRMTQSIEKLVNKEITSKITVTDAEIKDFYDKNKDNFNPPPGFHLLHILVTPAPEIEIKNNKQDDAKTPAEAAAKAQRLLHDIQGGQDFAVVARDYSEDYNSAPAGGDIGFQSIEALNNIDPRLGEIVKTMKVGETSPVVPSRFGFHIVKLVEKDPGGPKDLADTRVKQQIHQVISSRKDQTLKNAFSEIARNNAKVTNYFAERVLASAGK